MQTKLEKSGIILRDENLVKNNRGKYNEYDSTQASQEYGGKGTNSGGPSHTQILDVYEGGSKTDINGNENISFSGRKNNLILNEYSPETPYDYKSIDTSANQGIIIG